MYPRGIILRLETQPIIARIYNCRHWMSLCVTAGERLVHAMIFLLLTAVAGVIAVLSWICKTTFPNRQWHIHYFACDSDTLPYRTESFTCRELLKAAVELCVRQGNDDVVKITGPGF
jgi:hypothetical protein